MHTIEMNVIGFQCGLIAQTAKKNRTVVIKTELLGLVGVKNQGATPVSTKNFISTPSIAMGIIIKLGLWIQNSA